MKLFNLRSLGVFRIKLNLADKYLLNEPFLKNTLDKTSKFETQYKVSKQEAHL